MRAFALGLWGAVLLQSSLSGRLDLLLSGVFHPLVALSGVALLLLAGLLLRGQESPAPSRRQAIPKIWWLSAAVALLVLAIPPNPSFSTLAANRPAELGDETELSFVLPPAQRSLTDWVRLLRSQPDPSLYAGDPVRISGFVLPQPDEPPSWRGCWCAVASPMPPRWACRCAGRPAGCPGRINGWRWKAPWLLKKATARVAAW